MPRCAGVKSTPRRAGVSEAGGGKRRVVRVMRRVVRAAGISD